MIYRLSTGGFPENRVEYGFVEGDGSISDFHKEFAAVVKDSPRWDPNELFTEWLITNKGFRRVQVEDVFIERI